MAFRQSYTSVKKPSEPTTFIGKYGLKRTAGLADIGDEAYVIPLDMDNGYSCIPYHTLKKNGDKGFKDSAFASVKIACKRYDKETGEASKELPLCCKLAQMEKDRKPEKDDSIYRALSFTNNRYVIPVLVLSSTEEDPKKKVSMKKLSVNGISFSYLDLAETSYEKEFQNKVIEELEANGDIDDVSEMDKEEVLSKVVDYVRHSIIKVSNVKADSPSIPYVKSFKVIPIENKTIGEISGEGGVIRTLCKQLAGEYGPEVYEKIYAKYPVLKEINNQIADYITLFNDNVDSIVEDWTEEELEKYYNSYIDKQEQVNKYKDINEANRANAESDEDVEFEDEVPAKPIEKVADEDDFLADEDEDIDFNAPVKEKTPARELAAVGAAASASEETFDYSSVSLETNTAEAALDSILADDEFAEDDFSLEDEDFS